MAKIIDDLVQYMLAARSVKLPAEVVQKGKSHLLDSLAAIVSGSQLRPGQLGLQHARALSKIAQIPRRDGYVCPTCNTAPPIGNYWKCSQCQQPFDTFQTQGACPSCGRQFPVTACLDCHRAHPMNEWVPQVR